LSREFVPFSDSIAGEWDNTVYASPDGWVFGLAAWQRLILDVDRWALRDHSFALRLDGKITAVMPLQFNPGSKRMTSSGWGGAGPIVHGDHGDKARDRILGIMLKHARQIAAEAGAEILDFVISPVTQSSLAEHWGVNPYVLHGFRDVSLVSQVIDLTNDEFELRAALSDKTKSTMRKAAADRIEVKQVGWRDYLDEYYDVHTETYERTGVPPHPKEYFAGIAEHIAPSSHAVLLAAFDRSGKVIGFNNTARFGKAAFYHTGCSRQAALANGTNHLLLWSAIMTARAQGCRWFDVGTINPASEDPKVRGLTLFKTRFGGEPHRFFGAEMVLTKPATDEVAAPELDTPTLAANHSSASDAIWWRKIFRKAANS
jgi:hypothetical protein